MQNKLVLGIFACVLLITSCKNSETEESEPLAIERGARFIHVTVRNANLRPKPAPQAKFEKSELCPLPYGIKLALQEPATRVGVYAKIKLKESDAKKYCRGKEDWYAYAPSYATLQNTSIRRPQNEEESKGNSNEVKYASVPGWKPEWNTYIAEGLERKVGDADASILLDPDRIKTEDLQHLDCLGFKTATREQRKAFWALLFASIAYAESNFNPYTSNTTDPSGGSYGLLQLSYPDASWAQPCDFDRSKRNIFDPKVNLQCGIGVMRFQIERKWSTPKKYANRIFHSRAERTQWRVLEIYGPGAYPDKVGQFFRKYKDQLGFCEK